MADDKRDITKWASKDGQFRRQASSFRDQIQVGGKFPPEEGRYMLYVSLACPWACVSLPDSPGRDDAR